MKYTFIHRRYSFYSVVITMLVFLVISSCQQDSPSPSPTQTSVEIPSALQGTQWFDTDGNTVVFTKDTATVKPKNGSSQSFKIKEVITQNGITTLYFSDSKTSDYIVIGNNAITSVNIGGINKTGGFNKGQGNGEIPKQAEFPSYLFNTKWQNKVADTVEFTKTTITIKTASNEYTYTFKEATVITQENYTLLYFKDTEQTEAITVQNQKVTMVNFNCINLNNRGGLNQWFEYDPKLTPVIPLKFQNTTWIFKNFGDSGFRDILNAKLQIFDTYAIFENTDTKAKFKIIFTTGIFNYYLGWICIFTNDGTYDTTVTYSGQWNINNFFHKTLYVVFDDYEVRPQGYNNNYFLTYWDDKPFNIDEYDESRHIWTSGRGIILYDDPELIKSTWIKQ